ncbi:LysE family translocator [Desulfopila inferna]|uniref:LysE family translocator n=1 Tax=Desulfopila inferna TaxID=468528 RepID=UPI00196691F9|nr:LysE family translocator [Desulfopila inferna]MBM9605055.1 LysE family translocator [Desulfopila inferna]
MDLESWLLFSSIALVATITPGPAVLLVATHSISCGRQRTIYTILGNISGLFIMSLLSVLGVGALVLYSATAFTIIKGAGALYLIYLGIRLWKRGFATPVAYGWKSSAAKRASGIKMYSQGLMVALSNPKAIAFTTALFPQFIDHNFALVPQFAILVVTFMTYSFICLSVYARLSAGSGAGRRNSRTQIIMSRIFASLFIGSGIGLGLSS